MGWVLQGTDWPPESDSAAQDLQQAINDLPDFPEDVIHFKASVGEFISVLEGVYERLQKVSEKYGKKERGFRDGIKYNISSLRSGRCADTLRTCRDDVQNASAILRNCLKNLSASGDPASLSGLSPGVAEDLKKRILTRDGALIAAKKTFEVIEAGSEAIPVVGGFVGVAAKVGLAFINMIETMGQNETVSEELASHTSKLSSCLAHFEKKVGPENRDEVAAHIEDLRTELERVQEKVETWKTSGPFKKLFLSSDHADELKANQEMFQTALERMQLLISLKTTDIVFELRDIILHAERTRLLDRLGDGSYGARGGAIEEVICLHRTRVEILNRIDKWIKNTSSSADRVLWIRGMAGRGKSTIASTVAHNWGSKGSGAIFHFRRGENTLDGQFICALARQLGKDLVPEVKNAILDCVRENEDIAKKRLEQQFKTLFVGALGKIQNRTHPIVIVVDALDECKNVNDAVRFARLIGEHSASLPANIKFLLTCRPEPPILLALELGKWRAEDLDSVSDVSEDITRFLQRACTQIREDHGLHNAWPSSIDLERMVEMSQGLFQWARTAIAYIGGGSPDHRLRELLKRQSQWAGLDDLYDQILSKAFNEAGEDSEREDVLSLVLGTLVVAPYPVTLDVIAFLHADHEIFNGQENTVRFLREDILAGLNSLLHIPKSPSEPVRLMHASIRDLLTTRKRCKNERYFVDSIQGHRNLARLSLQIMRHDLEQNICNLPRVPMANSEIEEAVTRRVHPGLRYCCRAWSTHLAAGVSLLEATGDSQSIVLDNFKLFSDEKLLSWLEVMSLIGAMIEAYTIAKDMHQWLLEWPQDISNDSLNTLWNDTQRFITAFFKPISSNAFDIYSSALPRCPLETELWLKYRGQARGLMLVGNRERNWSAHIWTTSANSHVTTVTFSPDRRFVASGSGDGTVQLWDERTGAPVGEPWTGQSNSITTVVFSPDGMVLAYGSDDNAVRLWDVRTATPLGGPLTGHTELVISLAFSPDGKVLASGSHDNAVRLWDVQTGASLGGPLTSHSDLITSVVFSPDGKVIASGSYDNTVQLWDVQTRAPLGDPLTGHSHWIMSIVFLLDGKILACGSHDKTVRVWDVRTGAAFGYWLTGHSASITSAVFSPDGKVLASGSYDNTIRLWDVQTGAPLGDPLIGHSKLITSIVFSRDGEVVVSGSVDETVRLWNARTGARLSDPQPGHRRSVTAVGFSLDGKVLASGSVDRTVRLWDAQNGAPSGGPLTGHGEFIRSVVFSPNDKVLASGSADQNVRLWDVQTGQPLGGPLIGHTAKVLSVVFSPDGKVLASGSEDTTIRLWDVKTGAQLSDPLTDHSGMVRSVVFSPDGKVLASGSHDHTVRLWDMQTRKPLGDPLRGHKNWVTSVVFSPDGKVLASGSFDQTVQLWDVQTRARSGSLLFGHSNCITSVAFSPDGQVLASGSVDQTVRLWNVGAQELLGDALTGHNKWIMSVVFLLDGAILASVSPDGMVRFWDPLTSQPIIIST